MPVTTSAIIEALRRVRGPDLAGNVVELGLVSEILITDGKVSFAIEIPAERAQELEPLRQAAQSVVAGLPGVTSATVVLTASRDKAAAPSASVRPAESARVARARAAAVHPAAPAGRTAPPAQESGARHAAAVPGVRHLIAVASGKGGVGKSTVAVNLALGLAQLGLSVGILDADIYGPSQPKLLGLSGKPKAGADKKLIPMEAYGIRVMSMGFLIDEATPIVWRGPMVVSALNQMLREVAWGIGGKDLDVLVIDMPPGTGDVQLSIAQQAPLSGAIIVSTPQDLALLDARKGLNMFRKVDVPVLGIVENMSTFVCPKCGERSDIFGHGGAEEEARRLGVPFLGGVPLHMEIRERSDAGTPVVATHADSPNAAVFREIAARAWSGVEAAGQTRSAPPRLTVSPASDSLTVAFDDGRRWELPAEMLRVMSPSAEVQGHSPSQRVTVGGKRKVKIRELRPVGNYAVRIVFDDGHDTGLYSWTYLDELGREKDQRWAAYLEELAKKGLNRG
jgi:ATP-binding protein involved in chromosome partitioning